MNLLLRSVRKVLVDGSFPFVFVFDGCNGSRVFAESKGVGGLTLLEASARESPPSLILASECAGAVGVPLCILGRTVHASHLPSMSLHSKQTRPRNLICTIRWGDHHDASLRVKRVLARVWLAPMASLFVEAVLVSVYANVEALLICCAGVYAMHRQIVAPEGLRVLSRLVVAHLQSGNAHWMCIICWDSSFECLGECVSRCSCFFFFGCACAMVTPDVLSTHFSAT